MSIIVKSLSYAHTDGELLFKDLNFTIYKGSKAALVGNNGMGKSTLLKIISGHLEQSGGEVILPEKPYYIPQHLGQYDRHTVAQALGVDLKLNAMYAILNGDTDAENFSVLNDDWEIEERVKAAMSFWKIEYLNHSEKLESLSGGEKTKLFLAGILIHSPEIILLDEPSNHLDADSREILYDFIRKSKNTILVVSHDKTLLNFLDTTLEISEKGIELFGGNYSFYNEMKEGKLRSLQSRLDETEKNLKQTKQRASELAEQRQKQESRGKKQSQKKALPRIVAGGLGGKAEQSSAKLKDTQNEKINDISEALKDIRQQIQEQKVLKIDMKSSGLHKGKILIEANEINYSYGKNNLWSEPLTFQVRSGDRICIKGKNSTGKTTLIKILTGALKLTTGKISMSEFGYIYIDQEYSMIEHSLSVFEQVLRFNDRHLREHELKMLLHYHQLPQNTWDRKCEALSGGEKMKLLLCCVAVSNNTPDIVILDEPTNNLDIYSQNILTEALKSFSGTIILISHDICFIDEICINGTIQIPG
jgi:ATPase components of ABC transporters with duplicated ATPase domains